MLVALIALLVIVRPAAAQDSPEFAVAVDPPGTGSLVADPTFDYAAELSREDLYSGRGAYTRGSLDTEILAAVLRERATRASLEALADVFADAASGLAGRRYARDILDASVALFSNPSGVRPTEIRAFLRVVVRALVAEAIVATRLDRRLETGTLGTFSLAQLDADKRRDVRAFLVDATYAALGARGIFRAARPREPLCPDDEDPALQPLCSALRDPGPGDLLVDAYADRIAELVGLEEISRSVQIAAAVQRSLLSARGRAVDLETLIAVASRTTNVGSFDDRGALDPERWRAALPEEVTQRYRALYDALVILRSRLTPVSDPGPNLAGEIRAAAQRAIDAMGHGDGSLLPREDALEAWLAALTDTSRTSLVLTHPPESFDDVLESLSAFMLHAREVGHEERRLTAFVVQRFPEGGARRLADDLRASTVQELVEILTTGRDAVAATSRDIAILTPTASDQIVGLDRLAQETAKAAHVLGMLASIDASIVGNATVGSLLRSLAALTDGSTAPLVRLLGPVLDRVRAGERIDSDVALLIVRELSTERLVEMLGLAPPNVEPCEERTSAACLTVRMIDLVKDAIRRSEEDGAVRFTVDGETIADAAVQLGDDFRGNEPGSFFFHLTVGMGGLYSEPPDTSTAGAAGDPRLVGAASEQVGFGWVLAGSGGNEVVVKAGAFVSGILYRLILDNVESQSVMSGAFLAVDLEQLVELYVTGSLLFYPPDDGVDTQVRAGLGFGLQVPLGAYLERL